MKNKIKLSLLLGTALLMGSCSLNYDPISDYSELTFGNEAGTSGTKYQTKAEMQQQYDNIYKSIQDAQESWYMDMLVFAETHADNAYSGGTDAELVQLESNKQDGTNKNIERDWTSFLEYIVSANRVICNVDSVPDNTLTDAERKQWKAEASIWRAWVLFDMTRLWGEVPVVTQETPNITATNVKDMYPILFPARNSVEDVYKQIISDLQYGLQYAPNADATNKFKLTKSVAKTLLAKVYAEAPARDYAKVIEYCESIKKDGFSLVANYSDLFSVNDSKTDVNYRNTSESIFEVVYPLGSGSWVTWMFGIDQCDPSSTYNWAKWITPSRDLIQAYENEGDNVRMNEAIVWGQPSWSIHYPSDHYPFMYKTRSKYNSILKFRLADVLLLEAEAYAAQGNLTSAADLVDQIRVRAKLAKLDASAKSSKDNMVNAVLKERRLELAFEGQRWFDLVRTGKVYEVMNSLNSRDSGRKKMATFTESSLLLPVPQTQIDSNPNLTQNKGY
ncbi:RagB/SusD family nutrient uptake outer membrane protein [uncultured Bacteroides sp.]|uniref:RagB/SusD family nutrient uptake outer membrane protein n=1 Tax=uncultured Bacteroides sp. TaxID=162156 RepID=UPI002AAB1551|nr:RagB/SusD family nutrient uptake outer membrane protein [uncultured Bacteroides sp.]